MNKIKKSVALLIILVLSFSVILTGCSSAVSNPSEQSNAQAPAQQEKPKDPEFIRIGTASLGGNYFPMGAAIATILQNDIPGIKPNAQATGGSAFNMTAIQSGELEMGIIQGPSVAAGVNGTGQFEGAKTDKVRTILNYNATPQHIVVRANLNVRSVQDLKGLKLEMIAAGDGVEVSTRNLLEALGISWDQIKPQYSGNRVQAASRLKTGEVDGIIDATGIGSSWLIDVIGNEKFKLISLTDDEIKQVSSKYPEFSKIKIPAGSYQGQKEDIYTVSSWTVLAVSESLSDELVYNMTKALFDNKDALVEKHKYFKDLAPENIKDAVIAPMHPGALKYYKEKGILN
ncbi:MAG TPA: TAXI family TRAP transporter solute-binding subunit [Patescibacteria group bacterium]|nr:TAXI family TRAP transporter solute-binding subunit [Patescibacteria group bacterium]